MADRMEVEAKVVVTGDSKASNGKQRIKDAKDIQNLTEQTANSANKVKKALVDAFNKSAVIGWAKIIKDTINGMIKASEKQSEYIENVNMMQVAFGESAKSAERYVQSISNIVGFEQSGLTRQIGIFRQIASAMSYTSDVADLLSTNLSKMSLDISSLYNVSAERAGKSLESAITGQVRSIRSLTGADITLATLQQEAYRLGIEKTTREMTRAEKTILIYLSLERQLANANGDMARTINSVANQTKIFKDQIAMLGRQIGGFFIPILKTVLPILNGILMVINAIASTILSLFGIDASSLAKEFGVAIGGFEGLEEDLAGVESASDKAKKSLRGFDKLNNITTSTPSSSSGGAGMGIGGIDSGLLDALKEYNLHLDEIRNKATEIRDKILEWVGFTLDENGNLKFVGVTIGTIITAIGGVALAIKGVLKAIKVIKGLKILSNVSKLTKLLNPLVLGIIAIGAAFIYAYKTNDEFREKVNQLGVALKNTVMPIFEAVYYLLKNALEYIIKILEKLWKKVLVPLWELFVSLLVPIFEKIVDILTVLFEKIIQPLMPVLEFLANTLLLGIYNTISLIIDIIGGLIDMIQWGFDHIIKPIVDKIVGFIDNKIKPKVEGLTKAFDGVMNVVKSIFEFWNNAIFKDKNLNVNTSFSNGGNGAFGGGGSGGGRADGGFVNSGDIFYANENGKPEYIGSFGNQTAVANTDQIVDGIAIGVTKAMIATGANKESKVIIDAKGDASGLLDFITFEQRKKDRQYGL